MADKIKAGIRIKVGGGVNILVTTTVWGPLSTLRVYHHRKSLKGNKFLFGLVQETYVLEREIKVQKLDDEGKVVLDKKGNIVQETVRPAKIEALVKWDGPKNRTSVLPVEMLSPAKKVKRTTKKVKKA